MHNTRMKDAVNMPALFLVAALAVSTTCSSAEGLGELPTDRPLILAHRGSSGQLPEHTVEAYQLAVEQGSDVVECDLAVTKDMQLVCAHEPMLNHTTDVHSHPEFADRVRTYFVSSQRVTDYFTIDFTLEELKTLGKVQDRKYRDQSYNGKLAMASFEENIAVAQNSSNPKTVGIYPETKVPDFFNKFLESHGTTMEDILLEVLQKHGYTTKKSPCFIQSFDIRSIQYMANRTDVRLVFLSDFDISNSEMKNMTSYVSGLGVWKNIIVTVDEDTNMITNTTDFIKRAHGYGFTVHAYTFRNEYQFLAYDYGTDPYKEYERFFKLEVDGLFTDFPASMFNYMDLTTIDDSECPTGGATVPGNSPTMLGLLLLPVVVLQAVV